MEKRWVPFHLQIEISPHHPFAGIETDRGVVESSVTSGALPAGRRPRSVFSPNAHNLSRTLSISPYTAQVLINRGVSDAPEAAEFLNPSLKQMENPFLFKDMEKAAARIVTAIEKGEKVTIYGDYDVDGTTATALMLLFLNEAGADVDYYIPDRMLEGYGLNCDAVRRLAEQETKVIITVDNGISSFDEVKLASSLGLDVIVTDHHQVPRKVPEAYAVINPQQEDCPYSCKELAGVGVTFNLAAAVRLKLREKGFWAQAAPGMVNDEPNMKEYLDLVALGTVADIVPLVGLNRVLVIYGLKELSMGKRPGVRALKRVSGHEGEISTGVVGFQLAPRLNAAGRLSRADSGVRLLITEDEAEAGELAQELDRENRERRQIEAGILEEATALVEEGCLYNKSSIVIASEKWHPGVIGIVASRIVDRYYRPTILISLMGGAGKGSARSIEAFHIFEGLESCSEHLLKFGGHKYAAGITIDPSKIDIFRKAFEDVVSSSVSSDDFIPPLKIDSGIHLDELDDSLVAELEKLAPHGPSNPEPVFLAGDVEVMASKILKGSHLKMRLRQGERVFDSIAFGMSEKGIGEGDRVLIAFTPQFNTWNGSRKIQLKIRDVKRSDMDEALQIPLCAVDGR